MDTSPSGRLDLTRVRNSTFRETRETVINDNELGEALAQAGAIDDEYFRLRALAIISLLRLSGKRRTEISWIPLDNFKVEDDLLNVTFTLEKKKRRHKKCPSCGTKNPAASSFCKACGLGIAQVLIKWSFNLAS